MGLASRDVAAATLALLLALPLVAPLVAAQDEDATDVTTTTTAPCDLGGEWSTLLRGPQQKTASLTLIPVPGATAEGDDVRGTIRIAGDSFPLRGHRSFRGSLTEGTWGDARRGGTFSFQQVLGCDSFQGLLSEGAQQYSWDGTLTAPSATPDTGLPSAQQIEDYVRNQTQPTPQAPTPGETPEAPPLGATPETHATPTESVHVTDVPGPGILLMAGALLAGAWLFRRR